MRLPRLYRVRQKLNPPVVPDIAAAVNSEIRKLPLAGRLTPGGRVAVTGGSRGVVNIAAILRATCDTLKALGATNVRNQGPLVSARVPVSALGKLAADPALKYARSPLATTETLPAKAVSQGDVSLRADIAREESAVDGTGITVGLLSDSFACNPPAFLPGAPTSSKDQDVTNDELPSIINILKDGPCPDGTDEGRAMLQLVHDVAPAAGLSFATANLLYMDMSDGPRRLIRFVAVGR